MAAVRGKQAIDETTWTTDAYRAYLYGMRWPQGFECPHCFGTKCGKMLGNGCVACRKCGKQVSVTVRTFLEGCRLPLPKVLAAARYLCSKPAGVSARQLQSAIGLPRYESALSLLDRFRRAMEWTDMELLDHRVAVTTAEVPVADTGMTATVLVCLQDGRHAEPHLSLRHLPNHTKPSILRGLQRVVTRGSRILTNMEFEWPVRAARDYRHEQVDGERRCQPLERCRRVCEALCDWLNEVHHGAVRAAKLQGYLNEFAFLQAYGDRPDFAYDELVRRLLRDPLGRFRYHV